MTSTGTGDLVRLYERNCAVQSDIHEHLPTFVQAVQDLGAQRVIELGVRAGVSTVAWLYGLETTDGHLWSVDVTPAPEMPSDRWTFVQGFDTAPATLDQLPDVVDIVFIDTSHEYQHTLTELATFAPRVRSGGRILLHDTELEHPELTDDRDFPVKRAVDLFCMANGYVWNNDPRCYGLATIEIR